MRKSRPKAGRQVSKKTHVDRVEAIEPEQLARRERYFEFFVIAALLAFGIYHSILYFGHKIVPTSDFPAFFKIGHQLLSFQVPSRFKQAPVYGLLLACFSYVVGGQTPNLRAGWLLNAIWHPFSLVLFWTVAKRIVGKSALWFAIIAILSPWVMRMLTDPIVETTLLFFILLTFHFIFKRSNWSYLFASITTMVRYEGAALIMAAFVMDMIYSTSRRQKLRAFAYSAMASVPLAIWLLGTALTWSTASGSHYLKIFGSQSYYSKLLSAPYESRVGFILNMRVLWQTGFYPLLMPYPGASKDFVKILLVLSKTIAVVGFLFGSIYGLCKRRWNILAMLIFVVPYFWVHARLPAPLMRYHMPVFWIALLICWFGLQGSWKLLDRNGRVPRALVLIFQAAVVIIAIIWFVSLVPYLSRTSSISPRSASLPYVAMILVALIFAVRVFIYKARYFLRELSILALMCLVIVSNQFPLVRTVGDGQRDKEFKLLAEWYVANAKPGEKLGIYMAGVVRIFAPEHAEYVVYLPKADSPAKLVEACYEKDITYVVWATREGLSKDHPDYLAAGLDKNIALLREPRDIGPYQFITQVGWKRGYVNVFRLQRPGGNTKGKPAVK